MKRTVVVPDLQVPYHDAVAVKNVASFIKAFRPDSVVTLGDEIDLPQISRWTENTPGWYEQTLAADRDEAVEVLWSLVEHSKEAHMIRSNHTDRLYNVTMKKIPAFLALPELRFEKFFRHSRQNSERHLARSLVHCLERNAHGYSGAFLLAAGVDLFDLSRWNFFDGFLSKFVDLGCPLLDCLVHVAEGFGSDVFLIFHQIESSGCCSFSMIAICRQWSRSHCLRA